MTTRLLSAEDIYDVYGLESLLGRDLDQEDARMIAHRLVDIRDIYVAACKSRIRAEARFVGIKLEGDQFSFSHALAQIKNTIGEAVQKEAQRAARTGGPMNLMGTILQAHRAAGNDLKGIDVSRFGLSAEAPPPPPKKDVDPNWFMKIDGHGARVWDNPRWADIAKAYLAVEAANTPREIVGAIDRLNQLQHNSFHVLIDLQTGRMLNDFTNQTDDREARARLQEVLNIKLNAKGVGEFRGKMSPDVRELLMKYRL